VCSEELYSTAKRRRVEAGVQLFLVVDEDEGIGKAKMEYNFMARQMAAVFNLTARVWMDAYA
jgi:hypothetical protein